MSHKLGRVDGMLVSLCSTRAKNFYHTVEDGFIRRLNPYQVEKDVCTYCGLRFGWDYIIRTKACRESACPSKRGGGKHA